MPEESPIFRSQDVPKTPGVYVYRNSAGDVIYVGKARNLRSRMSSYFRPSNINKSDPRRRALMHPPQPRAAPMSWHRVRT